MKFFVLLNIFFISILSESFSYPKQAMLDKTETKYLMDIYKQLDGKNWNKNDWSKLKVGKIYEVSNLIIFSGISITDDRDTIIDGEYIDIYKIKGIDFSKVLGNKFISNLEIPNVSFSKLTDLQITNFHNCKGLDNINIPNVQYIKIYDSKISGKLNLKKMNNLVYLETDRANINVEMSELNLPNCKHFVLYDAGINSDFSIVNMENVESFIIDSKLYFIDGVDYYNGISTLNGNASELNKLKNAKTIIAYRTGLSGNLDKLDSPSLELIELIDNNITGNLPSFESSHIHTINLAENQFEGNFNLPINNSTLFIDVSENNLSGELNFNINFENLQVFKINNNKLTGEIPSIIGDNLFHIDLSYNEFNGLRNEVNVSENTFIKIDNNKIPLNELVSRCDLFPEDREPFIEHLTIPNNILREFKFVNHKYHLDYIGTDVISDYFEIQHIQMGENNLTFDETTNKIIVKDFDTLYNYKVAYKYNPNANNHTLDYSIKIDEPLTKEGVYRVMTTSKYCNIKRIDEIDITKLSVKKDDDFFVFKDGNQLIIENRKNDLYSIIQVYDLLGNLLFNDEKLNTNSTQIEIQNINQPLFIKIYFNNKWYVKKVL